MRQAFVKALGEIAAADDRVVLLTGDLGFHVLEPFAESNPERFINVGVAEANMMGVAESLAARGLIPYCYSIATFASMRGYEQLRDGAALHRLSVRVVGVGAGVGYGALGATHQASEDVAILRVMPGMAVVAPTDPRQVTSAVRLIHERRWPVYLRLAKSAPPLEALAPTIEWDGVQIIGDGSVAIVAYGAVVGAALAAAKSLRAEGTDARVVPVPVLAPVPQSELRAALQGCRLVVTAEDHRRSGGLGSVVAELIAEHGTGVRLVRLGHDGPFDHHLGRESYLQKKMGIDPAGIAAAAHHALARASSPDGRSHCPSGSISTTRLWRSGFSWVWSSTVTERRLPEAPARR